MKKTYTGLTAVTKENLLLDSGAFFTGFDLETDTYETAKEDGKLLSATSGGGEFKVVAVYRKIPVDGAKGQTKGLDELEYWDVNLSTTCIEITESVLKKALAAAKASDARNTKYTKIEGESELQESAYEDNVTWVGRLKGSAEPIIITIYNALHKEGLTITPQDGNEAKVPLNFVGHYTADDPDKPPFSIMYPKKAAV